MAKLVTDIVRRTVSKSRHRKLSRPAMRVGLVIKRNDYWGACRVQLVELYRSDYLNMYFQEHFLHWAEDPFDCENGDVVLLKPLDEPLSDKIEHKVQEVVFKGGRVVDPITGRLCRGPDFMDLAPRVFPELQKDVVPKDGTPV